MISSKSSTKYKDPKENIELNFHYFTFKLIKSWAVIH